MHDLTALNLDLYTHRHLVDHAAERRRAQQEFESAFNRGRRRRFWSKPGGECRTMHHLSTLGPSHNLSYAGIRPVTLKNIVGSENRSGEFDRDFYPTAHHIEMRWVNIATAMLRGTALPPVTLIQV